MTALVKRSVRRVYHQHGLLTFLLCFIPLIPGFIEHHTLAYVHLVERLSGIPVSAKEPAVQKVFGTRGTKTILRHRSAVTPIHTSDISREFFVTNNPNVGISLVQRLFFDKRLRSIPHSDVTRSQVISLLPKFLSTYPGTQAQLHRSTLIRQIAWVSLTESAIEPRHTTITIFTKILSAVSATEQLRRQYRRNQEMALLEAKIKGDLSGKATAFDPDFVTLTDIQPPRTHLVTQSDIDLMTKTLNRLTQSTAPEISLAAYSSLKTLEDSNLIIS